MKALQEAIPVIEALAESVRSTYGPRGADKLIQCNDGSIVITNDGATLLSLLKLEHPIAQVLVQISAAQDAEIGDGTTGVVLLACALLQKANDLLRISLHPTTIYTGFQQAGQLAQDFIASIAEAANQASSDADLQLLARSSLNSKVVALDQQHFASLVVEAVKITNAQSPHDIDICCVTGGSLADSALIRGFLFPVPFVYAGHESLPKQLDSPRLLLLDLELEHKHLRETAHISVTPQVVAEAVQAEYSVFEQKMQLILQSGVQLVLSTQSVGDYATQMFARAGIVALGRVPRHIMTRAAQVCSAQLLRYLDDITSEGLQRFTGSCARYHETMFGSERFEVFECTQCEASVLVRGGSQMLLDEAERSLRDALSVVICARQFPQTVPGGGCVEAAVSARVRALAQQRDNTERVVLEAFADAVLELPRALLDNAGLDSAPLVAQLVRAHAKDLSTFLPLGVNVVNKGELIDMRVAGVIEPAVSKQHALALALQITEALLRVGNVVMLKEPDVEATDKAVAEAARQQRIAQRMAKRAPVARALTQQWAFTP